MEVKMRKCAKLGAFTVIDVVYSDGHTSADLYISLL